MASLVESNPIYSVGRVGFSFEITGWDEPKSLCGVLRIEAWLRWKDQHVLCTEYWNSVRRVKTRVPERRTTSNPYSILSADGINSRTGDFTGLEPSDQSNLEIGRNPESRMLQGQTIDESVWVQSVSVLRTSNKSKWPAHKTSGLTRNKRTNEIRQNLNARGDSWKCTQQQLKLGGCE